MCLVFKYLNKNYFYLILSEDTCKLAYKNIELKWPNIFLGICVFFENTITNKKCVLRAV